MGAERYAQARLRQGSDGSGGRRAASQRCTLIALATHSFQARAFYQRLGFEIVGSHRDYRRGHLKHYLRKTLKK